jgi:Flp pilus assembly protein TadG
MKLATMTIPSKSVATMKPATANFTAAVVAGARSAAAAARRLARFTDECRGVAAVEFAILLPMMLTLFLGSIEVSTGVAIQRKVSLSAHAVADLASQYTSISNADMSGILGTSTVAGAPADIIWPYPAAKLQAVVSELAIDGQGNATVVWSDTLNGTARAVGSSVTLPAGLATPDTYLIMGEASYNYNPTYGYVLTGAMTLSDQIFVRPRQSNSVARTP